MKILLVDDEKLSRNMMAKYITGLLGYDAVQCEDGSSALDIFKKQQFDIVISDIKMPNTNGIELLQQIKSIPEGLECAVVLITGFAEIDTAVQALRAGAYDYLYKPVDVNRLAEIIAKRQKEIEEQAKESIRTTHVPAKYRDDGNLEYKNNTGYLENGAYFNLPSGERIGVFSRTMKDVINMSMILHKDRSVPVLIEGESGTGKEVIAKIIHYGTDANEDRPLVSINCSAISASLFESELFGYEGHTFTGAKDGGMVGKLELANGGTLFLDEIGDMPLEMQPKLLRVLQDKQLFKIGANKPIHLDIRVVAATNRDLEKMVSEGKFRGDLYHRLKIGWVNLPPLREQRGSIPAIAQMFLVELAQRRNKQFRFMSKDAIKILTDYEWPGNIRELRNIIERIVLLYDEIELRTEHLSLLNQGQRYEDTDDKFVLVPGAFKLPETDFNLREIELEVVKLALKRFKNNKSKTAQFLGLTLSAMRSRLDDIHEKIK